MDVFFDVWDWSKKRYALSRIVKIDLEECSIRVYHEDRLIVIAKGEADDVDSVYLDAALKLDSWAKLRGEGKNGEYLYSLWQEV